MKDLPDLFPYAYRGRQEEMVRLVRDNVEKGGTLVAESGTGTGKTVVSLAGVLQAVHGTGRKVIYLTRTKSQQRQVISEVSEISKKLPTVCVALQGRNPASCPLMASDPEAKGGTPEELSKLCGEYKKGSSDHPPCEFCDNINSISIDDVVDYIKTDNPEPEEFERYCRHRRMCPYELMKLLLPYADVIAVPYPFVFMPHVLDHFLQWLGTGLPNTVMIVDEAHNLPDYLREVMTCEYSSGALDLADKEAIEWGDPEIFRGLTVTDVISVFRECMQAAADEYLTGEDGMLPPFFLQDELMERLGMSSISVNGICRALEDQGEIISNVKKAKRRLPRSYIGSLGRFITSWGLCDGETYVPLIVEDKGLKFQAYCLDPYEPAEPLRYCYSSVSMSGTLQPLSDYTMLLGLSDATERVFDSPFPKENLKVIRADDVSTKYDELNNTPEILVRLEDHVVSALRCTDRNTAVFFPSYSLMERFVSDGVPERSGRRIYIDRKEMTQPILMDMISGFRSSGGGVLFSVTGGRISEGLDFPDKDLEIAVIVGIPYPKPTVRQEALRMYCEYRFGDGWEHAVRIPAMRKMRQAIGRLIRSETDRGVAVILDRRVSVMKEIDSESTNNLCGDIREFLFGDKSNM